MNKKGITCFFLRVEKVGGKPSPLLLSVDVTGDLPSPKAADI